jgi:hypothetical protein
MDSGGVKSKTKCTKPKSKSKSKHVVVDGKEYTEFTSYKGKGNVMPGDVLVGPTRTTKHGKKRLVIRHRPLKKTTTRELLPMTNIEHAIRIQADGTHSVHFVDDDSQNAYNAHLEAVKYGGSGRQAGTKTDDDEPPQVPPQMQESALRNVRL